MSQWDIFKSIIIGYKGDEDIKKVAIEKCKVCNENAILEEDGMRVCTKCGYNNDEIIDTTQEWRSYGENDNKTTDQTRCVINNSLLENGTLSTCPIGYGGGGLKQLSNWNKLSYDERSKLEVFSIIDDKVGNILPKCVTNKAKVFFTSLAKDDIRRGDKRLSLIAACVFFAGKYRDYYKTQEEIGKLFGLSKRKIIMGCKDFHKIMFMKDRRFTNKIKPTSVADMVKKYNTDLGLNGDFTEIVDKCIIRADYLGLTFKCKPSSAALAIIYFIIQEFELSITMKYLKEISGVSGGTILKIYNDLVLYKDYIL